MCVEYKIKLHPFVVGKYNLDYLNIGYRFALWYRQDNSYYRGLLCNTGKIVKVVLTQSNKELLLTVHSATRLTKKELELITQKIVFSLGLDDNLSGLKILIRRDKHIKTAYDELEGYRLKATPSLYEVIFAAMISQNCSLDMYLLMLDRFIKRYGRNVVINEEAIYAFPLPEDISNKEVSHLASTPLYYRAEYIKNVAVQLTDKFLIELTRKSSAQGVNELKRFKGIGDYTARVCQIYGMRRYDLVFVDTYVRKLIGRLYLNKPVATPRELFEFTSKHWGDWQAYALDILIAYAQLNKIV